MLSSPIFVYKNKLLLPIFSGLHNLPIPTARQHQTMEIHILTFYSTSRHDKRRKNYKSPTETNHHMHTHSLLSALYHIALSASFLGILR